MVRNMVCVFVSTLETLCHKPLDTVPREVIMTVLYWVKGAVYYCVFDVWVFDRLDNVFTKDFVAGDCLEFLVF